MKTEHLVRGEISMSGLQSVTFEDKFTCSCSQPVTLYIMTDERGKESLLGKTE